jgi:hypothetical protein
MAGMSERRFTFGDAVTLKRDGTLLPCAVVGMSVENGVNLCTVEFPDGSDTEVAESELEPFWLAK